MYITDTFIWIFVTILLLLSAKNIFILFLFIFASIYNFLFEIPNIILNEIEKTYFWIRSICLKLLRPFLS